MRAGVPQTLRLPPLSSTVPSSRARFTLHHFAHLFNPPSLFLRNLVIRLLPSPFRPLLPRAGLFSPPLWYAAYLLYRVTRVS